MTPPTDLTIVEARYSPPRLGSLGLVGCTWIQPMNPSVPQHQVVCMARVRCRDGAMIYEDLPHELPLLVLEAMQSAIETPTPWWARVPADAHCQLN